MLRRSLSHLNIRKACLFQNYFIIANWIAHEGLAFLFNKAYYCKVRSSNMSRLEAHAGFFRMLMKGIFDHYVNTVTF